MSLRRRTDPVYLQFIWSAIEANPESADFDRIFTVIQSDFDQKCAMHKLKRELSNSILDGCVKSVGTLYFLKKDFLKISKDRSDWYCYECHLPGPVVSCPTCFRVYHSECLPAAIETHRSYRIHTEDPTLGTDQEPETRGPPDYPCSVCNRITRATSTPSDLRKVFQVTLDCFRHRVGWKTMHTVGYVDESRRNEYFLFEQVNTATIAFRLRENPSSNGYPTRTTFLVDLDNLVHNCSVIYGSKHAFSNTARQIRSQLKRSMRESTYCVDCYLRSSHMSSAARMTVACRAPHRILWFQHNGWSFRPCKMLYESPEGYEVICFGGRHEREFVPVQRALDTTFSATDLGLRMTPSLKKALDEAEEYRANQSAHDRRLPIPIPASVPAPLTSEPTKQKTADQNGDSALAKSRGRKRKSGASSIPSTNGSISGSSITSTKRKKSKSVASIKSELPTPTLRVRKPVDVHSDSSLSSLDSDENSSDDDSHTKRSKRRSGWRVDCVVKSKVEERDNFYHDDEHRVSSFDANRTVIHHSQSLPVTNGLQSYVVSQPSKKTVIRIKPLPLPEDRRRSSVNGSPNKIDELGSRAETASSSGCATIPAIASLDDVRSADSLFSTSSHSSSNNTDNRSRKSRLTEQNSKKINRSDPPVDRFPLSNRPVQSSNSPPKHQRAPSLSVLSSLSDSDSSCSSVSSASSRSQSPTSSDLSSSVSTSISSTPSTRLSLTRRYSLSSTHPSYLTTKTAFSHQKTDTAPSFPVAACSVSTPSHNLDSTVPSSSTKLVNELHSHPKLSRDPDDNHTNRQRKFVDRLPQENEKKKLSKKKHDKVPSNRPPATNPTDLISTSTATNISNPINTVSTCQKPNVGLITTITASKVGKSTLSNSNSWSSMTKLSSGGVGTGTGGGRTPVTTDLNGVNSGGNSSNPSATATPSSSSSCYSSVSPAALSITSGLGSSVSDPKSVDASPAEVALLLGNTSFPYSTCSIQSTTVLQSTEEHAYRIYADRLVALTVERDQAREELVRRDALINRMRREHEAEIKRVKQLTWCQVCLEEALYHCCPGTAYCSEACQLQHWNDQHNGVCRRRGESQQASQQQ